MEKAENLNGFIELARLFRFFSSKSFYGLRGDLFEAFYKFVDRPEIFKDVKALEEANELHSQIDDEYPYVAAVLISKDSNRQVKYLKDYLFTSTITNKLLLKKLFLDSSFQTSYIKIPQRFR